MKCPKCGKEVTGNFCPECGAALTSQPSPAVGVASTPNKKKGKGCLIVILVILVLAIISAALGGQDQPASSTQQNTNSSSPATTSSQPESGSNSQDTMTTGQKNALRAAEKYLSVMPFSYSGLIEQLEYESYSTEDATYAADNCSADWNEQAAKSAKKYLDVPVVQIPNIVPQFEETANLKKEKSNYTIIFL